MKRRLFKHLATEEALAARILLKLGELGGVGHRVSKRELERALNANKQANWHGALVVLLRKGCVRVSAGPNRQRFITLVEIPDELQGKESIKKRRRKRKATGWFKQRLPEFLRRDGYDERDKES
jgi:hypothetical protein